MTEHECPEETADALRDAMALVRACLAGDMNGLEAVAHNLADPMFTACALAQWLANEMTVAGLGESEVREFGAGLGIDQA